ncbi:MAG: hypothetical protein ACD_4C00009G0006 [uncultured bacterium (gcode 4)]|uniref:Uncharacterized protein n=1 Tax=uncultured bacterium (gcode 4) TaxID=1234023 RepID=K2FZ56_9BACT|nr:MAG: hypothetical protein ACD_4C00009G0006 [uncultured bacterium (gcode 4)]
MVNENLQKLIDSNDSVWILEFLVSKEYVNSILEIKTNISRSKWFALDIDETLSATNYSYFDLILEKFWNPENLSVDGMVKKYHMATNVPYYKNPEIESWFNEKRNCNDFQFNIPLIENADKIYQEIHEKHIDISLYITARPETVKESTTLWLEKHNFPKAWIILKPSNLEFQYWNLWKACVLDILYPEIQWIVDDNPDLVKYLPKDYRGIVYAYSHTQDWGRDNVISCTSHEDVKTHIWTYFNK